MKIVRVIHDSFSQCYGPFSDEEAWTFAGKVDKSLRKISTEIMNVEPPRHFVDPETGKPLDIP